MLKTSWFDSIDHNYLIKCVERLGLPAWIPEFLRGVTARWKIDIRSGRDTIMSKAIGRGTLQGDSLSPLLFVLCMDPLSRRLNRMHTKVSVQTDYGMHVTNYLLFIDDFKLLATNDRDLKRMAEETLQFFNVVGLETNRDKSATNSVVCSAEAVLLEGTQGYKYLGVIEDNRSRPTQESFDKIKAKLLGRVRRVCNTKLNGKHTIKAINEHAISLINYYVGLLRLEPKHFQELDHEI